MESRRTEKTAGDHCPDRRVGSSRMSSSTLACSTNLPSASNSDQAQRMLVRLTNDSLSRDGRGTRPSPAEARAVMRAWEKTSGSWRRAKVKAQERAVTRSGGEEKRRDSEEEGQGVDRREARGPEAHGIGE